jgi:hypothetical protein
MQKVSNEKEFWIGWACAALSLIVGTAAAVWWVTG